MKINEIVARNTVIIFADALTAQFVNLGQQIGRAVPSKVVLNYEDMIPHLTLYSTRFPKKNLAKLERHLSELAKGVKPFSLKLFSKSITAGTVFIDAQLSEDLYQLHEKFVDGLNSLREGAYDEKELELPGLTQGMKNSLVTYGMLLAKEEYRPHLTVARPFDSQRSKEALAVLPGKIDFTSEITSVSLVETGLNGT